MDQNQLEKQKEEKQQRLMMIIEKVEKQLEDFQVQNQDNVIMLIGKTGCGKSTIYNFLCGAQFQLCEDEYGSRTLELLSKSNKYQEIKGGLDSTTKKPKIYYEQEYQHSIIDYPGFNDTEGNDQLEIQLFFNKIVSLSKIKIVYVLLNPGDQFQNKAEDLQNFINEADIDISKLTVIINSYSKKRTDEQLIADFQSQLMNKFKKQAHQLIVQRDIDETEKIEKYLSNEHRKKMWMQLINSKVISIKPYDLSIYQDVNNFIDNANQELSDSLFQILKDLQYKQYQTKKTQEIHENIKKLENFNLILQRFLEGDVYMLYQIMMFVGTFNENYMKAISRIYSFFLEYKIQLNGYLKMENSLLKANSNLKICLDYLYLNQKFLEQLKQVEEKKNLLENEKQMMKIEKSNMEDRIRKKEDELYNLKELLQQTQVNFKYEMENQIKLIQDQTLQETTIIINDKIKIEQELSKIQVQYTDIQNKFTQLQNDNNKIVMEFEKMKNQYNQDIINLELKEQTIQSQNNRANNQIMILQQNLLEIKVQNKKISEHSQYLQTINKETNEKLMISQKEKIEIEKQLNHHINQLKKKDLDYQKIFDQFNEFKAKNTIEQQRKQLLEESISKLMKSQNQNNNIELQNNMNEISNQFIQASQQNQTMFVPQQQQCEQNENSLQNQQKSQKDGKNHSEKIKLKPVVVLIGITGSGKTTLFNKICNAQEKVVACGRSITRQSILGKSAYGNEFYVIDTPGLGTYQNKIDHAVGIWNAMQEQPLNKILIILRLEKLSLMIKQLLKQIIILRRYRKIVIVAITHFDQSNQQQIDQQSILEEMKIYGIQQVLFFSKNDSGQSICNQIDQYLSHSIPIQVEITQEELLNYFDLLDESEFEDDFQFMEELSIISTKLRKMISQKVKFSLQSFEQQAYADEIYFKVQNEIKIYTQLLIKERKQIIQELLNKISNNQQYQETFNIYWFDSVEKLVEYLLQKEWFLEIKQFSQQALSYLSKNSASIINCLKVCQNCCLVWYCQSNSNNVHFCGISLQDENKSLFDDQFWTTVQLFNTVNDISEYQNKQQYIKEYIKKRNSQNISHGCGKQLDLLSLNQNQFEYFYLSLDLFNQSSQYYFEQNKYIELLNLIQKVKQSKPVNYLQF